MMAFLPSDILQISMFIFILTNIPLYHNCEIQTKNPKICPQKKPKSRRVNSPAPRRERQRQQARLKSRARVPTGPDAARSTSVPESVKPRRFRRDARGRFVFDAWQLRQSGQDKNHSGRKSMILKTWRRRRRRLRVYMQCAPRRCGTSP